MEIAPSHTEAQARCPLESAVRAYKKLELAEEEVSGVEAHLAGGCEYCNNLQAQLDAQPDEVAEEVRRALAGTRPDRVDQFRIEAELGGGGMGVVYQAHDENLHRTVALKMVLAGGLTSPEAVARFGAEAEAVARLNHPNIVTVYGRGRWTPPGAATPVPYIALEYVPGRSLAARWAHAPQPPQAVAATVGRLAAAVQHAHEHGVVHRDLKPANVLLIDDDTPKVTDFGLARRLDAGEDRLTRTRAVMGTPSYMAPEQADGRTKEVGPRTDVYALGAILYEGLTGAPPFRGVTLSAILEQIRSADPVRPRRLQPTVPKDLETICLKCLAKVPAERYAAAGDLAADLELFREGRPIRARSTSWPVRLRKWVVRRPWQTATAGLAIGVLVVTAILLPVYFSEQARQERAVSGARAEAAREQAIALLNQYYRLSSEAATAAGQTGGGSGQSMPSARPSR